MPDVTVAPPATAGSANCLIVDDEPSVRRSLVRMLQAKGFTCFEAGSGREALGVLERIGEAPLVISDMRMPELDGIGLLDAVRRQYPDTSVIMLTGMSETTTARTSILFSPGVRVALLRSRDQKVELFGEVDLCLGHTFLSPSPDNGTDTSNFHLTYTLGPGLRYWVHPQLALSALAALNGQFEFDSTHVSGSTITTTTSTGLTNIVAALQVTGIF